jgi:uncharacterized protein GlcG (DUF336 family)
MTMRLALAWLAAPVFAAAADSATFTTRSLTPETALKAAQAALAKCRSDGFQVAVAIVDRGGLAQVVLRDRFAGAHTLDVATNKAWSAVSFRGSTADLERASRPGEVMSGLRHFPRTTAVAGGLPVEAGGSILGGIGVSGAPGGANDEACAAAGLKAIAEDLEL